MFSLDGKVTSGGSNIGKNGRKWFSRFLKKIFLLDENSVPLLVIRFLFIKINLPQERIVLSTFKKKWEIKTVVFSKSIIGSDYEELGIIWLF